MNCLLKVSLSLGVIGCLFFSVTSVEAISITQSKTEKVMREFHGVKLGMKREAVQTAMAAKPEESTDSSEDYKLTGEDTMTVRYENGEVKAIQLAFRDAKNAPTWEDVVGNAEVNELANGAKTARKTMEDEKFWVSIYKSQDGATVRITISRN